MAHTYCMDEEQWKKVIVPVKPATFIGPPTDCNQTNENFPIRDYCKSIHLSDVPARAIYSSKHVLPSPLLVTDKCWDKTH